MRPAVVVVLLTSVGLLGAQHHSAPAPAAGKVTLLSSLGSHHHPIATNNPEAQKFFDQGLTLSFGFNHDAASAPSASRGRMEPSRTRARRSFPAACDGGPA